MAKSNGISVDTQKSLVIFFRRILPQRLLPTRLTHLLAKIRVFPEILNLFREIFHVPGCKEEAGFAIINNFRDPPKAGGDNRFAVQHGFDKNQAKW